MWWRPATISLLCVLLLGQAACGGSNEARPQPSPSPSPASTISATATAPSATATAAGATSDAPGADGFRAFAAQIQSALDARDEAFFHDRIELASGICTETDVQGGPGTAPCTRVGDPWEGFPVGYWQSEGTYLTPAEAMSWVGELVDTSLPGASDEFGYGEPGVYALSPIQGDAIITALIERPPNFVEGGPLRVARVTHWSFDGTRWRLKNMLVAAVGAEDFLIPCPEGVSYLRGEWERFPDRTAPRLDQSLCRL